MKKIVIEDVKVSVGSDYMACGPVGGPVVAEILVKDEDGQKFFVSMVEVDGMPNVYKTEESTFKYHTFEMEDVLSEDEIMDFFGNLNRNCFLGYGSYEDILEDAENELYEVLRYLMYLVRCDSSEEEQFISDTIGKNIYDIDIPLSDIEEVYMECEDDCDDEISIISSRTMTNFDDCFNPEDGIQWLSGVVVADGEMVLNDNDHEVYLHSEYCEGEIEHLITAESVYDLDYKFNMTGESDGLVEEKDRIISKGLDKYFNEFNLEDRYEEYFKSLDTSVRKAFYEK